MERTKHYILVCLCACLFAAGLTGCGRSNTTVIPESPATTAEADAQATTAEAADTDNEAFHQYLTDEFIESVSEDTLTLHYSLKDPSAYGIDLEPTLGDLDFASIEKTETELNEALDKLNAFDYTSLSKTQQSDYNILKTYITDNLDMLQYNMYGTGLGTVGGIQCNMPINLAEYQFYTEKDITDYLALLSQIPDYFQAVLDFEQKRIDEGLGLQDFHLDQIIDQCKSVLKNRDTNYLISTFDSRIDAFEGIDDAKKESYKEQNKEAVTKYIFPAYESMVKTVKTFYGKATIDGGLCNLPNGKTYYEKLVRHNTGTTKTMDEIISMLDNGLSDTLTKMQRAAMIDSEGFNAYFEDNAVNYGSDDPSILLDTLKLSMMQDYPEGPQTTYTIKYVQKELEDSLSPAFYMVPPIDDSIENVIYINNGSTDTSGLFTTLAHEGYPGHLYQTNYYNATNPEPIRNLLNFGGYVEGWASYVEMQSPELFLFAEHNEAYTLMEEAMTKLNLVISSRIDVGVNYEDWTLDNVKSYLTENGLNESVANDLYEYVICEPSNYLKYCVSALEFFELQSYAQQKLANDFDMKAFNKALLDCGPCQFEYVKQSVDNYISETLNK